MYTANSKLISLYLCTCTCIKYHSIIDCEYTVMHVCFTILYTLIHLI